MYTTCKHDPINSFNVLQKEDFGKKALDFLRDINLYNSL